MSKLEIALVAASFGWTLAQATELLRLYWRINSKKSSVLEELFELKMLLKEGAESAKNLCIKLWQSGKFFLFS